LAPGTGGLDRAREWGRGSARPHRGNRPSGYPVHSSEAANPFRGADSKGVDSLLFILVPRDGNAEEHLQLLAWAAQIFANKAFRSRLAAAKDDAQARAAFARHAHRG
jgi:mannitol/fructose-specific phosphotransferase system IIA component (Ntr-type)